MQYGGPDLRDPANYRRALEDYQRRRQAAERGGYIEDFNMHPDDLLRMQQPMERGMEFPTFPGPMDRTPTNSGRKGGRTETYEECQAGLPEGVLYIQDPCKGKPHAGGDPNAGFKNIIDTVDRLGRLPKSERPSSPIGLPPQQGDMDPFIQAGAINFLGEFLGNLIRGNK